MLSSRGKIGSGSGLRNSGDSTSVDINQPNQRPEGANVLQSSDERLRGRASASSTRHPEDNASRARGEAMWKEFSHALTDGGVSATHQLMQQDYKNPSQSKYNNTLSSAQLIRLGDLTKGGKKSMTVALKIMGIPYHEAIALLLNTRTTDGLTDVGRQQLREKKQQEEQDQK